MDTFLHKVQGLVSSGETGRAIESCLTLLQCVQFLGRDDPLMDEFWDEADALDHRWRLAANSRGNDGEHFLELGRLNFLVVQLARKLVLRPALARKANEGFHYAFHLKDHLQGFIGTTVGGYELIEFVGMGGFGTVFKGRHGYTKRIAAVKVSHPIADGERVVDDLLAISLPPLRHLDHPYVARLLDAGEVRFDGYRRMYVVTEFVAGGTLREFCLAEDKSSPERIRSALQIAVKVCEGLAHCHATRFLHASGFEAVGIKHGDLKPENVLLDEQGNPKLIDFMFVDLTRLYRVMTLQPEFTKSTGFGTRLFGTYGYMAPEQREQGVVTEQSDIYALGVLLLEVFGRVVPDKSFAASFASPEEVARGLPEGVPSVVSRIIHRATQSEPSDRYRSVAEVEAELQEALAASVPSGDKSSPKVFISYRRKDSAAMAGRICDYLRSRLGGGSVFMDVYAIPAGADFRLCLDEAVAGCDVLLALIGPGWADEAARLSNPGDFIRIELEAALSRDCLVIPVLLSDARMPSAEVLPETIRVLRYRNALCVDHGKDYHVHMEVLLSAIDAAGRTRPTAQQTVTAAQAASIRFRCPECQGKLKAPGAAATKRLRCPQCQTVVTVPGC